MVNVNPLRASRAEIQCLLVVCLMIVASGCCEPAKEAAKFLVTLQGAPLADRQECFRYIIHQMRYGRAESDESSVHAFRDCDEHRYAISAIRGLGSDRPDSYLLSFHSLRFESTLNVQSVIRSRLGNPFGFAADDTPGWLFRGGLVRLAAASGGFYFESPAWVGDPLDMLRNPRLATIPPLDEIDARVLEHTGNTLSHLPPYTQIRDDDVPEADRIFTDVQGEISTGLREPRVKSVGFVSMYRGRDMHTTADHFVRLFALMGLTSFAPDLRSSFDRYQREIGTNKWGVYEAGNVVVVIFRDDIPYQGGLTAYYAYLFDRTLFPPQEREEMRRREPRSERTPDFKSPSGKHR